jgi:cbb3-type cytochrome oxidase subunit 3
MKKTAVTALLIVLLLLSLGANAFLFSEKSKGQIAIENEIQMRRQRDSVEQELLRVEDSLNALVQNYRNENATLVSKVELLEGDNNPRVIEAYKQIYSLRRQLARGGNTGTSMGKTGSLEDLRRQLEEAKKRVAELMAQIEQMSNERAIMVAELDSARENNQILSAENFDLKDRLERGARPQFGALLTTGLMQRKGQREPSTSAKNLEKFMITFDILENPLVTSVVEEQIVIRVIDPNGAILSTTNKSLQDKSTVVSLNETIQFDGALQKVKWYFPQKGTLEGRLTKGKYTCELWTRGLLRQKNTFELN